jgi:non-heme chloroperoxidase
MKRIQIWILALGAASGAGVYGQQGSAPQPAQPADTVAHTVQIVQVEPDVKLEVLDWGGSGRPLILLAGLGNDAHVFDQFALKLVPTYHVYGITRRGFGASSAPRPDCENYSADRLGDDVLAVMNALKIDRPVLVGHSIAGEELSSIGTRFPEKIAGLVYLDAAYAYAYYDDNAKLGMPIVDFDALRIEVAKASNPAPLREQKTAIKHLLEVTLPRIERDLQEGQKSLADLPDSTPDPPDTPAIRINVAIMKGAQVYGGIKSPVLAVFADPHSLGSRGPADPDKKAAMIAKDHEQTTAQADAFQGGNPAAHVVKIPNADHFIFRSNEAEVLREVNAFLASLK